jgi:hypothetical protein
MSAVNTHQGLAPPQNNPMEDTIMMLAQETELGLHPKAIVEAYCLSHPDAFRLFDRARITRSFYTFRNWVQGHRNPTDKTKLETYALYQELLKLGRQPLKPEAIAQYTYQIEW